MNDINIPIGQQAITLLQQIAVAQKLIPRGVVLDDDQLIRLWNHALQGQIESIPDAVTLIRTLITQCGDDPDRPGLVETPDRFLKAMSEYTQGYGKNPNEVFKTFEDGAEKYDEIVLVRNIDINSLCEHHMAPFFGHAHIGYIPQGKIAGLSKLSRLADVFAHRLQVQERLTAEIAGALWDGLKPLAVGVVLECTHTCMSCRGINKQGSTAVTSAMYGAFKTKPEARAEFLSLVHGG